MKRLHFWFFAVLLLSVAACQPLRKTAAPDGLTLEARYIAAVADAATPENSEVSRRLLAIASSNKALVRKNINGEEYVLMVAWKAAKDTVYYKNNEKGFYNTGKRDLWVTAVPEVKGFAAKNRFLADGENPHLRMQQLLGLPPDADANNVAPRAFIEFWVRPQDLFRPCPDAEIEDRRCECDLETQDEKHGAWLKQYRESSYKNDNPYYTFPWTQLGYTYDWNPRSRKNVGLSEYVVLQGANIVMHKIWGTSEYLGK